MPNERFCFKGNSGVFQWESQTNLKYESKSVIPGKLRYFFTVKISPLSTGLMENFRVKLSDKWSV